MQHNADRECRIVHRQYDGWAGLDCITRSQTQRLVKRELGHHVYCYINANLFST